MTGNVLFNQLKPPERIIEKQIRTVPCPTCNAKVGDPCYSIYDGARWNASHWRRLQVYRDQPTPVSDHAPQQA